MSTSTVPAFIKDIESRLRKRLDYLNSIHNKAVVDAREREVHSRDEEGSETYEREKALRNFTAEEKEIEGINIFLEKIRDGTYGVCQECKKPIDPERLNAVPLTELCERCCHIKKH